MKIILKRVIDHETLSFKGWEFLTEEEIYVEEYGDTRDLFRLEFSKPHNEYSIMVANYDEYCVHEDATEDFPDIEVVIKEIKNQESVYIKEGTISEIDSTYHYLEYIREEEEED
jgi:hypothetical protein